MQHTTARLQEDLLFPRNSVISESILSHYLIFVPQIQHDKWSRIHFRLKFFLLSYVLKTIYTYNHENQETYEKDSPYVMCLGFWAILVCSDLRP